MSEKGSKKRNGLVFLAFSPFLLFVCLFRFNMMVTIVGWILGEFTRRTTETKNLSKENEGTRDRLVQAHVYTHTQTQ